MKKAGTFFALIGFIAIAVFGFAIMGTHSMNDQSDCIASTGQTLLCPHQNALFMTELHAQFFERMTSAVSLTILLAIIVWAVVERLNRKSLGLFFQTQTNWLRRRLTEINQKLRQHSLFSWLALCERGDALLAFAIV